MLAPNGTARVLSGAAGSYTSIQLGRTAVEGTFGIAAAAGHFDGSAVAGDVVIRSSAGALRFNTNNGVGISPLTILGGNGNVGIGTVAPAQALHVVGTERVSTLVSGVNGAIVRSNTNGDMAITNFTGSASDILLGNNTFGTVTTAGGITGTCGSGANYVPKMSSTTAITCSQIFDNGTNVGIGTTSPAEHLNLVGVHGTTQMRLTLPAAANGGGTGDVNLQIWASEPGVTWDAGGIGTNVANNGGAPSGFGRLNAGLGQSYIRFVTNGGAMAFNTTNNAGTYYQTMYMTGGNVGIGTTGPSEKLHILDGNVYVQNSNTFQSALVTKDGSVELYRSPSSVNAVANGYIDFKNASTDDYDFRINYDYSLGTNGGFVLRSSTDGSTATDAVRMAILNGNGNVGIGVGVPTAPLDITRPANTFTALHFLETGQAEATLGHNSGDANFYITNTYALGSAGLGTAAKSITLSNAGNVGIGTTNPDTKFQVALGNTDRLAVYQPADNILAIQTLLDGAPFATYGTSFGNGSNVISLQPMVGFVGIGTTGPNTTLHVQGGNSATGVARFTNTDYVSGVSGSGLLIITGAISGNTYTRLCAYSGGFTAWNNLCLQDGGGRVGIGTTNPGYTLDVAGSFNATSLYCNTALWCSDVRYKRDITLLKNSLDNVLKMQGVNYFWKTKDFPDRKFTDAKQIGFIAQEIEKIYPELVNTNEDGYKSVDYSKFTPILVEAIKEQQEIIDNLKVENERQKSVSDARIAKLEAAVQAMQQTTKEEAKK